MIDRNFSTGFWPVFSSFVIVSLVLPWIGLKAQDAFFHVSLPLFGWLLIFIGTLLWLEASMKADQSARVRGGLCGVFLGLMVAVPSCAYFY